MKGDTLRIIHDNPTITPEALATVNGCSLATAKSRIYAVRRIERLTGVPVSSWKLTRETTCNDCGTHIVLKTKAGDAREFCDACRRARRLRSVRKYNAKMTAEQRQKRQGRTFDGVWVHRTRVARAVSYLRTNPNASISDFGAHMEMGKDVARFLYAHMKKLAKNT